LGVSFGAPSSFGGISVNSAPLNNGIRWWAEMALYEGIQIWDLETTGMSKTDVPVEIAIVDGATGVAVYESLIYTEVPIHPKALEVHGITQEMLAGRPTFDRVLADVYELLLSNHSATYNAFFDTRIWKQGGEEFPGKVWCLMEAYKMYANLPRKVNLSSALLQMGIPVTNNHRALGDAQAAAALLRGMADGVVPNSEAQLQLADVEVNSAGDNDFVKSPAEELIFLLNEF
jgi:DNA polymerase III epsilon subunit-like protein